MRPLVLALLLLAPAPAGARPFGPLIDPLASHKQLFEAGKYGDVIEKLTPASMQKLRGQNVKRAYFYLGTSYERTGRLARALGVYQLAAKLFPKDIDLLSALANLLHSTGMEEQAEPLYQKILHIRPNNAVAHLGLAEIDHSLGFLDSSAGHYEKALETLADQPRLWRDYAEVLLAQKDSATAELAARKSLLLSPDADTLVTLAFIQRAKGDLDEALASLERARGLALRPDIALAQALWLLEAGRYETALPIAEEVLRDSPGQPLALWIRARIRLKQDRYNDAGKDLEEAAKASRESPFAAKAAQALLSRLKGPR